MLDWNKSTSQTSSCLFLSLAVYEAADLNDTCIALAGGFRTSKSLSFSALPLRWESLVMFGVHQWSLWTTHLKGGSVGRIWQYSEVPPLIFLVSACWFTSDMLKNVKQSSFTLNIFALLLKTLHLAFSVTVKTGWWAQFSWRWHVKAMVSHIFIQV